MTQRVMFKAYVSAGFPSRCTDEGCEAKLPWGYDAQRDQNEALCACGRCYVCASTSRGNVVVCPGCPTCWRRLGPLPDCARCGGEGEVDKPAGRGEEVTEQCGCVAACPCADDDLTGMTPVELVKACLRLHLFKGMPGPNATVASLCGGIVSAGTEAINVMTLTACEISGKLCKGCMRVMAEEESSRHG